MTTRSIVRWIGAGIGFAALAFVVVRLVENADRIPPVRWTPAGVAGFAAAILLSAVPTLVAVAGMPILLSAAGVTVTWRTSFAVVGRSQIGKYLPGNLFHYVGRVALGVRRGLPAGPLSLAVGVETALTVAVALTIGVVGWFWDGPPGELHAGAIGRGVIWISVVVGSLIVLVLIVAPVRRRASQWYGSGRIRGAPQAVLTTAALYVLAFVSLGLAIDTLLRAVLGIEPQWHWSQFTWRFAFIWVLGLVTIGAPAGLGVREALMLVWFSPVIGESAALGVAALLRMVTTAADVLIFLAASGSDTALASDRGDFD